MTPEEFRASIPALDDCIYLNTGAGGPSPRRVVEAVQRSIEYHEYEAPAGDGTYGALFEALDETRETVAAHFGGRPTDYALTQSTSDGIGRVIAAMDWGSDDVVVRTDQEHSACLLPCQRLRDAYDVEVREVPVHDGGIDPDEWAEAVDGATLAMFSSLCWTDGCRLDVPELSAVAQDAGARVLVDAVQSVGQRPVDFEAWGADAVAAAGHKWLLGPTGTGFLYVDEGFVEQLDPVMPGYMSIEYADEERYDLHPDARSLEVGSVSPVPYAGLREAIATMAELGMPTILDRIERLTDRLKEGLGDRLVSPEAFESGLVAFQADDPEATVERLAEQDIVVRAIPQTGDVRVSLHVFNDESDVDALLDAL